MRAARGHGGKARAHWGIAKFTPSGSLPNSPRRRAFAPLDRDPQLAAVESGGRAAVGRAVGDLGREHLAADVGLVCAGRGEQLLVAAEAQGDPVGDLQAGLFARVLDGVDDLAGEALATQLVVEL